MSTKTAAAERIRVLWRGDHLALIKRAGVSYSGYNGMGTQYLPQEVWLVTKAHVGIEHSSYHLYREKVLRGGKDGERLTKAKLAELIASAEKRDAGWPAEIEAARVAAQQKKEAEARAAHRCRMIREAQDALIAAAADPARDGDLIGLAEIYRAALCLPE